MQLVADVNTLYREANEQSTSINKELELKRGLYKSASIIEKPALFAAMMGVSGVLNFHQRLTRTTMQWMRHKKIPKKH
jgi:hypothetical protein